MTDKHFEDFIRENAKGYNTPPETPHDEMWARIDHARGSRTRAPQVVLLRSHTVRWAMGVAASLVLGIAIGITLASDGGTPDAPLVADGSNSSASNGVGNVVRLVAFQHLSQAEVFLTMFRADVRSGHQLEELTDPARDLLSTTRLLRGSAAADDPQLGQLLDDLELLLIQIAQLQVEHDGEEADLIADGIDQRNVLIKLRAAVPADPSLAGVQGVL